MGKGKQKAQRKERDRFSLKGLFRAAGRPGRKRKGRDSMFDHVTPSQMGSDWRGRTGPAPHRPAPLKPEEMDPAMLAAIMDHRIGLGPEGLDALRKPLTVVLAGNGVFEIRKNRFGMASKALATFATPLVGVPDKLKEGYQLTVPKLPWSMFQQVVAFFRDVNDAYHAEAYLQIWFNHDKGEWFFYCPLQDISGGTVEHDGDLDKVPDGNLSHVIDIHSHNTMGAFFSSTDDGDESRNERVYGVVGMVDKMIPAWKWRMRTTGKFIDVQIDDVVDVPTEPVKFRLDDYTLPFSALINQSGKDPVIVFPKGTVLDPFAGVDYPKSDWWAQLIADPKDTRRLKTSRTDRREIPQMGMGTFWDRTQGHGAGSMGRGGMGFTRPQGQQGTTGASGVTEVPFTNEIDWEEHLISKFLHDPVTLPICTRHQDLGRPRLRLKQFSETTPAGYAVFYQQVDRFERAPFAEERAILGDLPQAGFIRFKEGPSTMIKHLGPLAGPDILGGR